MALTVRQALELPELTNCKMIAGISGIDNHIQYVDTMEVPDISPWLKKRELLVTTGYSIKNDTLALVSLVESLHKVQAAGILIKTRFLGSLPQEALDCANRLGLPMIEASNELSFAELINALMKAIVNDQNNRLEFSEKIHSKFTELELSGGGFDEIAEMLYSFLELPVIITNSEFQIAAIRPEASEELQGQYAQLLQKGSFTTFASSTLSEENIADSELGLRLLIRKARAKQHICGYIFTVLGEEPLDEMNNIVLDHALTTVALEYSKLEAIDQHQSLMDDNFLVDIIMRNVKSEEEASYRAHYLGWPSPPLALALFDINGFEEYIQSLTELEVLDLKRNISSTLSQTMLSEGISGVVISKSDRFFCISGDRHTDKLFEALQRIVKTVKEKMKIEMTVGCTTAVPDYLSLWQAHNETSDAIKICRICKKESPVAFIENLRLEQAILHSKDNPYLRQYVHNSVGKLEKYDSENGTDLLEILWELIRNMGIRTKTAEALFLHRNTLLYRIRKMELLTGYDLSRNEDLLKLAFAMLIKPFL